MTFLELFGPVRTPFVVISENLGRALIFNEDFVNNITFDKSEVITNAFEVFLKSEDYDRRVESLNQKIKSLQVEIQENKDYEGLKRDL